MKRKIFYIYLIAVLSVFACRLGGTPSPSAQSSQPPETATRTTSTAQSTESTTESTESTSTDSTATSPLATEAAPTEPPRRPSPTAAAPPEIETAPELSPDLPAPTLFDVAWTDRAIFQTGLVESERSVLEHRLGASVYHIQLEIEDSLTRLNGKEEVLYTNTETDPLEVIYFRLYPNIFGGETTLEQITVNGQAVSPIYEFSASAVRIPLAQPLLPNQQVVIGMDFSIRVATSGGGNYGIFIFDRDILALAHFYPIIAAYDDRGWDVEIPAENGDVIYADTSFYLVQVTAPDELVLVASGVEVDDQIKSAEPETAGQQVHTFAGGPMRDFYLAANRNYDVLSQTVGPVTVNSYFLPGKIQVADQGLTEAINAIKSYNQRFGQYPYTEFDIVPTPTQALGVEYPGLIVINMELYNRPRGFFEATIAHEVAHQWFYGVVGNDQLDEPWLDESLAQYLTYLYYLDTYSEAAAASYKQSWNQRWERFDSADLPIGLPVAEYEDGAAYSGIVYGRGPIFYDTLAQDLGQETVNEAIRAYYQAYKWDIATTENLQQAMETSCQCDLDEVFDAWIYPKK